MKKLHLEQRFYVRTNPMGDMYEVRYEQLTPVPLRREKHTSSRRPLVGGALVLLLLSGALVQAHSTGAYFGDVEESTGNTLGAGHLSFTLEGEPTTGTLAPGDTVPFVSTLTPAPGSVPFSYTVTASSTGGNPAFCGALTATVVAPPFNYSGSLLGLTSGTIIDTTPALVAIALPVDAIGFPDGATCGVDILYSAWQENGTTGTQYHDTQKVSLLLTASVPSQEIAPLQFFVPLSDTPPGDTPDLPLEEAPPTEEVPPEPVIVEEVVLPEPEDAGVEGERV